ncbi:diphthine--ammonia ligase [Ferroplasma sp.]|uniref:diphthine--ammonia ligase n=1 Tax=Ferroplasma sp. TaxID=2591003 RepID=UPI00307F2913
MKAVALFSGGKDSFLSAMIAMEQGYEMLYGITVVPEEYSMMFHYPNSKISEYAASLLGFGIKYINENDYKLYLSNLCRNGIDAIVTGAIASDYQKTRIEKICYSTDTIVYSPLWRKKQECVINQLLLRNIKAMIVSVSAEGFTEEDLGATIDENYLKHLKALNLINGINIAGEGGEYETFVYGLENIELNNLKKKKIWKNSGGYLIIDI